MLWPKKNSYKEFDNEKKFLRLKNSPPHNFSNGQSLRDFSSWSPVSCVLVTFCKRICYWAWSQWLRHWSAELQFEIELRIPRVFQRLLAQSLQELYRPLVLLYQCGIVEFYPTPYPHTLSWMRYKSVVWRKCKKIIIIIKRPQQMPSELDYDL